MVTRPVGRMEETQGYNYPTSIAYHILSPLLMSCQYTNWTALVLVNRIAIDVG